MDTLQAAYRDEDDDNASEAPTPPPQTTATSSPIAAAVDQSGTTPDLPEINQSNNEVELQTLAPVDPPIDDNSSYETPQTLTADISAAVDESGAMPDLPENNHTDEIKVDVETLAPIVPPIDDNSSYATPQTLAAVDQSGTTPGLPEINQSDEIQVDLETLAPIDPPIADNSSYATPQTLAADIPSAVDQSGTTPNLAENDHSNEIQVDIETLAPIVPSIDDNSSYATPQTLAADISSAVDQSGTTPNLPENNHTDEIQVDIETLTPQTLAADQIPQPVAQTPNPPSELNGDEGGEEEEEEEGPPPKKQKHLSDLPETTETPTATDADAIAPPPKAPASKSSKKSKKKSKDVWSTTTRKGKKKTKHAFGSNHNSNGEASVEDKVFIAPIPRFPDKNDDAPELKICLSKVNKAEKVELSDDRMTAGSTKGYRMVRATRGVSEGAWYFEIKVVHLGETGHTRLGWATEKGDLQAPVGYDGNSFGYRDIDGSKVHKALREKYGDEEGYKEGDVIGFYINLPDGGAYAPNPGRLVWHKGQRYVCAPDAKEDPPKVVPGSEISYFKNGICQGVAFTDLYGGCYYPAASMYTLPNQPACVVKFNFGPDFEKFPEDFGERPAPRSMIEVPYQSYDGRVENGSPWNITRPLFKVIKEENTKIMKATEMLD